MTAAIKIHLNFIFKRTHTNTPVIATMLSQDALQNDNIIATDSNTNATNAVVLFALLIFG